MASVLRGCGGHDAFLRTYRGLYTDREAAEFLIVDAVPAFDHARADRCRGQPGKVLRTTC